MKTSNFLSLNWKDVFKGLIMAILTPVVFLIQETIETGDLNFDWKKIAIAAFSGCVAYLIKNFFSPSTPV